MKYLDLTGLGEVWANIKSYISSKIPTKTSQLQNDSNYVTTSQLPSKTSQLINDSGFTTTADTVLKTNTDYTFRNYGLNSLNIDEKYNENYVVGISVDGYGTRPIGGWTNIINFCTYHFLTQLCIPIDVNKDTDCIYIRTRWANNTTWGEWRKSANDNSVVHKSGDETISGIKNFNDVVLGEQSGVIRIGNNGQGALFCNLYYDGGIYNNIKLFYPKTDNEYNLGTSTNKWANVYTNRISFPSDYYITTDTNDNSLRIIRDGTGHGNNYKVIIQGDTGKFFAPNGFIGNLQGNADTATSANDPNAVHKTGNENISGDKAFNNLIQARYRLCVYDGTNLHSFVDISRGWIEMSAPNYCYIDFKHETSQDYLGRIGINPNNILYLETINGAPIMANGKNIVRSVNGVNADNNGNVSIQNSSLPIGAYIQFAGSQAPSGFLVCNGGAISRTTYANLFAVIGTTYGSGDGSTTFNLPNLTDRFLQGDTRFIGTVKYAGLPNIRGTINIGTVDNAPESYSNGALSMVSAGDQGYQRAGSVRTLRSISFDASNYNRAYGNSSTIQPPALTCLICIKY